MRPSPAGPVTSFLAVALLLSPSSFAFDTPLSDQAVREAYFLGQRRDETMATFLNKYTKFFPPPKTGPDIASVTFFTPFALLVQQSSQHTSGYSAQQAALDHRAQGEFVRIVVQIWKDFDVQVSSEDQMLKPFSSSGQPNFICSEDGGCTLTGATLQFDFSVEDFASGSAAVDVVPPKGDPVSLDFDLDHLR